MYVIMMITNLKLWRRINEAYQVLFFCEHSFLRLFKGTYAMSEVFSRYFLYLFCQCVLSVCLVHRLINDMFIASLPGNFGKADKKTWKIKSEHSLPQRISQKYIAKYVADKYKKDYRIYMYIKAGIVVYYVIAFLALLYSGSEERKVALVWRIIRATSIPSSLFLIAHFDTNQRSKYTRNK